MRWGPRPPPRPGEGSGSVDRPRPARRRAREGNPARARAARCRSARRRARLRWAYGGAASRARRRPRAPPGRGRSCRGPRAAPSRPSSGTRGLGLRSEARLGLRLLLDANADPFLGSRHLADLGVERDPELAPTGDHALDREIERDAERIELEAFLLDRGHLDGPPEHDGDHELRDRVLDRGKPLPREEGLAALAEHVLEKARLEDLDPVDRDLHVEEIARGIDRDGAEPAVDADPDVAVGRLPAVRVALDDDDAELVPEGDRRALEVNDEALADRTLDRELGAEEIADDGLVDADQEAVARNEGAA